jgi:hypothetical protein
VVEFVTPLVKDTVYSTGPWQINAKVKTQTTAQIETPWLVYTATNGQGSVKDSVLMTMVKGDSLWKGNIPQFVFGTEVIYSITGKDITGNAASIISGYVIAKQNHPYGDTSVALTSIISPIQGQTMSSVTTPVTVTIRNKGDSILTSATIYRSINGVITSYPWTGNLPWEFETQVTIGNYITRTDMYDTIVVWISNPNNGTDILLSDDTLEIITYGCITGISGILTVGITGLFPNLQKALESLKDCNPSGDITIALEDGIYAENCDLSNISNIMGIYTLTITSLTNNADNVILHPEAGVGILMNNTNNIRIENITIDATSGTYAIQFTGTCSNIVVDNCTLLASPINTNIGYAGIYKASNTGDLDNMQITNCNIQGGYYGIHLYGESDNYCQNITIDNNIISNQYYYATYFYYINFNSVSYNRITPRSYNEGVRWYGLYFYYVRKGGNIIGNRVWADNSGISSNLYGMSASYIDSALVANNEIYLNSLAFTTYGVTWNYSNGVNYLHNTVLLTGTGGFIFIAAQIYVSTGSLYNATYKNNIFIANGGTTPYAVSLSVAPSATFAQYNHFDYNNYYSSGNLGYAGNALPDLAAWKSIVTTDTNSVSKMPNFIDIATNLELSEYDSLQCDLIPSVNTDIQGYQRGTPTTMGCFQEVLLSGNGALAGIFGLRKGTVVAGETDSIKVVFTNLGSTTLNSVELGWSVNGTIQTHREYFFTKPLPKWQSDTVTLDRITYISGNMDFKIWINSLENGTLLDGYSFNDTVGVSVSVCSNAITGIIPVGATNNYKTITAALQAIRNCGVGDITLLLDNGIYQENCDFSNVNRYMTGNTLTITSKTGKAEDVIIRPASSVAVRMENTRNVRIENITIDATQGTYGIQFFNACSNIVINHCIIFANPVATTIAYSCIYKAANTGSLMDLCITNCTITGGYSGIYLYGENTDYCRNIRVDSNIINDQYSYPAHFYYADLNSVSYNHVMLHSNSGTTWQGLSFHYTHKGRIAGNRIYAINSGSSVFLYGIYTNNIDSALVFNNEIYLNSSSTMIPGMYLDMSKDVDYLHNTVVINSTGLIAIAAYIIVSTDSSYHTTYKNNIFIANGGTQTSAIVLASAPTATFAQYNQIDYNNYYSSGVLGQAGIVCDDLAAWKSIIPSDIHSVSSLPLLRDITIDLKLADYDLFHCDLLPSVSADIEGASRKSPTAMGCYEESLLNVNGALTEIIGLRKGMIINGEADSLKVIFFNKGNAPFNSVNLEWSINGISQSPIDHFFSTPLTPLQSDTITLGKITYTYGNMDIKIWINTLEGGILIDEFLLNDTVSTSVFACSGNITGVIPVSDTSAFTSITAALQVIIHCGTGDITLLVDSGMYEENCDFSGLNSNMRGNTLTVTSKTGRAEDVVIKPLSGAGITLANTHNLTLKAITVDVSSGINSAIQFTKACTNITIRNCRLLANPASTNRTTFAAVYKGDATGVIDSVFFINNLLDGGRYGVCFAGGNITSTGQYSAHVICDSNTVSNQLEYGIYFNGTDLISCSHNTILSRTTNTFTSWYGIQIYNSNGDIVENRIIQRSNAIINPYGIHTSYLNCYPVPQNRRLLANNEIILNSTNPSYIIHAYHSKAEIIHNSIYVSGTGGVRGILIELATGNDLIVKNNNIVLTGTSAYPVYFIGTGNLQLYDLDYNNMYAPRYVGYYGRGIATIQAWQQTITTDQHSVSILPNFIDSSVNLELSDYSGLSCPLYPNVTDDIMGISRNSTTVMGAYSGLGHPFDLNIQQIICDTERIYPQPVPVKIEIANTGNIDNIDSATFGWSVNGVVQASHTWIASNPLIPGANLEVPIGSFSTIENTDIFDIVVWVESVNGTKDFVTWNDTARASVKIFFTGNNLRIVSMDRLVAEGALCADDYVALNINVQNTGTLDYDFAANPATFSIRVTNPEPYSLDTIISLGEIKSGEIAALEITNMFPIFVAGIYDIEVFLNSFVDTIKYDDTIRNNYISNRFGLPVDEDFSNGISSIFSVQSNTASVWDNISQGIGTDTAVIPQFGTGMLAFKGSPGSMSVLSTYQLDLSQTVQPALSFWYFHDTIPCEDYTDVRITIDGGTTYNTLFSLTKYNPVYGWQQYSMDLPSYAVNQCVILVFEAMEKSRSGDVTQYIDRILITAKQDIAVTEIIISEITACDLGNKEVKVVLSNLTDPVLDFATTPTMLTLEILETGETYTHLLDSGSLGRFASDTISIATGVNFSKGTYTLKAYFSSVLDVDRMNDTLVTSIVINPELSVSVYPESSPTNCLTGALVVNPTITLYNTGNMDLSGIDLILQVDTGENNPAVYTLFKETYTSTILAGDTAIYMFNSSYSVPWNARYDVRTYVYLSCDSALLNSTNMEQECVDIKDLRIISIDNPSVTVTKDAVGSSIPVTVTLNNRSDGDIFTDIPVNVRITNSQGIEQEAFMEPQTIGASATVSHAFTRTYTVPNDTVYYLSVFVNSQDNYRDNDTLTMKRYTESVGIETLKDVDGFTLSQNIPNPANNRTRIDYSIPEAGEVIFNVHSVSGQLLYSQTIEATNGKQSLELNTSSFAAGIYFYSIEYKGQRLVKRMIVQ